MSQSTEETRVTEWAVRWTPASALVYTGVRPHGSMNVEQFIERFLGTLYTEPGWEKPLTMERLHELLTQVLAEHHAEFYR